MRAMSEVRHARAEVSYRRLDALTALGFAVLFAATSLLALAA